MAEPCLNTAPCGPCDESPVRSVTVADVDRQTCLAIAYAAPPSNVVTTYPVHCEDYCFWELDPGNPTDCTADAWICAQREADQCAGQTFLNSLQRCSKTCPDGTSVSFTVPAGSFAGYNQAEADAKAMSYACQKVDQLMVDACDETKKKGNSAQTCTSTCPDGSTFTVTIPAGAFQATTQAAADQLAYDEACRQATAQCPGEPPLIFNTQQTCVFNCPDGSTYTYTVPEGTITGNTQAEADQLAYNFACAMAKQGCTTGLVPNTAQTCTVTCRDGTVITYSVPAGSFFGVDQASADAMAHSYACHAAQASCSDHPPRFYNTAQGCCRACPDGTYFCKVIPARTFSAATQSEANQLAYSAACQYAIVFRMCLSDINRYHCASGATLNLIWETIEVTGDYIDSVNQFQVVAGAIPTGMFFLTDPSHGHSAWVKGYCYKPGNYQFRVRCTVPSTGNYIEKWFEITILGIDNASPLPGGTQFSFYSVQLTNNSGSGHYQWMLFSGTLPDGITLGATSGKLEGTPTTPGSYSFAIGCIDTGHGNTNCAKPFTLEIAPGGFLLVPLRLYHDQNCTDIGGWRYGVDLVGSSFPQQFQSRMWTFVGSPGCGGPYSDTGLTVLLPVGMQDLGLFINPVSETSPVGHHVLNITPTTRLLGYDMKFTGGGRDITYDNAFFWPNALPDYVVGAAYDASVGTFESGITPVHWSLTDGSLPPGLFLHPDTGHIYGTPDTDVGFRTFTVTATDGTNTESCPFTIYCANQHLAVACTLNIPDHFARWNGPDGLNTLTPVGTKTLVLPTQFTDNLRAQKGYVAGIEDARVDNTGTAATPRGYVQLELSQNGVISPDWTFGNFNEFYIQIPIVNEVPTAPSCFFDGSTQYEDFANTPLTVTSTSIYFSVFSSSLPSGPVGDYHFYLQSKKELDDVAPPGSQTCLSSGVGDCHVT